MHVELRNIAGIKPYPNNPRHNDLAVDTIAWIQAFGCRQPIVVDEEGINIVGHTRYKAAQKLGLRTAAPSAEEAHHRQRRVAI
jgi:ParB-like chromosome segregation protein Spo0J